MKNDYEQPKIPPNKIMIRKAKKKHVILKPIKKPYCQQLEKSNTTKQKIRKISNTNNPVSKRHHEKHTQK